PRSDEHSPGRAPRPVGLLPPDEPERTSDGIPLEDPPGRTNEQGRADVKRDRRLTLKTSYGEKNGHGRRDQEDRRNLDENRDARAVAVSAGLGAKAGGGTAALDVAVAARVANPGTAAGKAVVSPAEDGVRREEEPDEPRRLVRDRRITVSLALLDEGLDERAG